MGAGWALTAGQWNHPEAWSPTLGVRPGRTRNQGLPACLACSQHGGLRWLEAKHECSSEQGRATCLLRPQSHPGHSCLPGLARISPVAKSNLEPYRRGASGKHSSSPCRWYAPPGWGGSVLKFCLANVDIFFSGAWGFMRVMLVGCKYDSGLLSGANCPCAIRP